MKSPFPGMDPYLEPNWRDIHATLIIYIRDQLQDQLGGSLRARVEQRLVVEADAEEVHAISPDARVFESVPSGRTGTALAVTATAVGPLVVPSPYEEHTETFIEIIDRATGDKLVTVIELLSPSNKVGQDARDAYRQKLVEVRQAGVNMVEIDLTRGGRRRLSIHPIRRSHRTTFQACVYRARGRRPQFEIYPMPLQLPLPAIKVPLRSKDADVVIDLQPLLAQAYRNGAYDDIDYTKPPVPPLTAADAALAATLLAGVKPPGSGTRRGRTGRSR